MGRGKRKYEEVVKGKGQKVPGSKGLRVPRLQHPKDPWSQGPKDEDISNSYSNKSLTLRRSILFDILLTHLK